MEQPSVHRRRNVCKGCDPQVSQLRNVFCQLHSHLICRRATDVCLGHPGLWQALESKTSTIFQRDYDVQCWLTAQQTTLK